MQYFGVGGIYVESTNTEDENNIDYSTMIEGEVFIGDYPMNTIIEGIQSQFEDYINMEDTTNYVDVFFTQLERSYQALDNEAEDHPQEIKEILNGIKDRFISEVFRLFEQRFTITINVVDDELTDEDEVELVIRQLYEFFVLSAKNNFKVAIAKHIIPRIDNSLDDDAYYQQMDELLQDYDPLIRCITPTEFLRYCGSETIADFYEDGEVSGNFLRKYSAKLYANEEFKTKLICYITMLLGIKEDMKNGSQETN